MNNDLEIARKVKIRPIAEIAAKLGIAQDVLEPYGHYKAKLPLDLIDESKVSQCNMILVSAISPTPAGEGKSTTSIGLTEGLNKIGKKATVVLREPSLGPVFGIKGGATGGGHSQVIPMEDINLHFTGDFSAIEKAHNLLSALIDNNIQSKTKSIGIDPRTVLWKRVMDMNDRSLRRIVVGLGGTGSGIPRETGFDITAASEVMAILCLSKDMKDLKERLGNIFIGFKMDRTPVYSRDLHAQGAMAALMKDAIKPNLVQTLEGNPAIIHGGPFANIAHGCNSVIATKTGLKLADYVVTEAGFGADLGAEKFLDIKCRKSNLKPSCVVIVATIRALKMHGGVAKDDLKNENVDALKKGLVNLERHIQNVQKFGLPVAVAVNHFIKDTDSEVKALIEFCDGMGVKASLCTHWANGGEGTKELAAHVSDLCEKNEANFKFLYESKTPLFKKIETIAKEIYRADEVIADTKIRDQLKSFEEAGFGELPICVAKTQYSFSTDPSLKGAPSGHSLPIREIRLSSGAEFIVVVCGAIMTMPGLPRVPAADSIKLNKDGEIEGLF